LYEAGLGVEKNLALAASLYEKAAGLDFEPAMRRLSAAYAKGELGLQPNTGLTHIWQETADRRAARGGFAFR
jgi:TPR repeat protein